MIHFVFHYILIKDKKMLWRVKLGWNYVYVASEVISKVRCCLSARQGKLNKFAQIADTSKEHSKSTKIISN